MEHELLLIPGSNWLYYKIYCGPNTSDSILIQHILPFAEYLREKKMISKWFFTRYYDGDYHLRVRFDITEPNNLNFIINNIYKVLNKYLTNGLIWNVVIDTYQREVDRYGKDSIELVEEIFHFDSLCSACLTTLFTKRNDQELRWLFTLRSIDEFLNDFGFSLMQKSEIITNIKNSFEQEFNINKIFRETIKTKYRANHKKINYILTCNIDTYPSLVQILDNRSLNCKNIIDQLLILERKDLLEKPIKEYMWSYVHMICNRILRSQHRIQELIIHNFLFKYYNSLLARERFSHLNR